jgi:predicted transglutaminase-like cysteine proteinase
MEQMELKFLEERNRTEYEALQRVTEANALVQNTIADAQEKIDAITVAKHEEIATLKAYFEAKIHNLREASAAEIQSMQQNAAKLITEADLMRQTTKKEASEQIELLKKESAEEIDRINNEANNQIKMLQKEASEKVGLADKNASRLSLIVSELQKQIHVLESERASLHEKLSATSNVSVPFFLCEDATLTHKNPFVAIFCMNYFNGIRILLTGKVSNNPIVTLP